MVDSEQMMRRQKVLADFGEFALRSGDLDAVLTEACRLVAEALGTGRAKILEIQEDGQCLFVRAGVGWKLDIVGHLRLPMSERSSETYSINEGKPVITQDIAKEERFEVPEFMKEAGVVALANVPIFVPGGQAFGLLQVDDTKPRAFSEEDTEFLRTYATLLGPVIDRLHKVRTLHRQEESFRLIVENTLDYAIVLTDAEDRITEWTPGAQAVFGWTADEIKGQYSAILFTPEDREAGEDRKEIETARREGFAPNVRWHLHKDGSRVFIEGVVRALRESNGELRGFLKIGQDVTERIQAEERLRESERHAKLLLAELQHRVRNTLAVVRSIARRTVQTSESVEDYAMHLEGRIDAFARVQAAVTRTPDAGLELTTLVADTLLSVAAQEGERVRHIKGPNVRLQAKAAETVALAIHELATNAVKYGALSAEQGRIEVEWTIEESPEQPRLVLRWTETGVRLSGEKPTRRGFGTELIERILAYDLGGEANLEFTPDGLHCTISLPATGDLVLENAQPARRS
ncbi:sensor histidine kinase [Microvirga makkahensis]|uniref:Blue-light-activated histidine kinase n=1 Tax=Microvirga makkahensis TaxID=1128670 RepID=A0A7X3MVR6_9HYPH|nr:PAS domain S-box protein [Microvirga makkahensis]